jgi:thiamine biosynthesis protein ThiI
MFPNTIIAHYGEIGLKGRNRSFFEGKLVTNIKKALKRVAPGNVFSVRRLYGRLLITLDPANEPPREEITDALRDVLGLVYFAWAYTVQPDLEKIKARVLDLLGEKSFNTFRITARRPDRNFPVSAQRLNEILGEAVVTYLKKKVDLTHPELTCYMDVVNGSAYIYTARIPGRGGLPVGVSGKVILLVSGGIDSPVAAYYLLKRGARVVYVHFHSVPYTDEASIDKVREIVRVLNRFQEQASLWLVPLAPIQKEIMLHTQARYRVLLYRRFMLRLADAIREREKALALITGDSLAQVASQTLENMGVIQEAIRTPVLRPLIGMDKQEIITRARDIHTYDISILPDQDCCSLFLPRHPATKARLPEVLAEESQLDVEALVEAALKEARKELISGT